MAKGKITNPHDKFVKEMFTDKDMAIAFLQATLPKSILDLINTTSLVIENTSFINKELSENFADILLKFDLISSDQPLYISILIENKSSPDLYVEFQLLEYVAGAYRKQLKMKEVLRPIIPFVYYHGHQTWQLKPLASFFEVYPAAIQKFLPTIESLFVSVKEMDEQHMGSVDNKMLYAALMLQRHRHDMKMLEKNIEQLILSLNEYSDWNFLKTILVYTISSTELNVSSIIDIAEKSQPPLKKVIMSTYDQILEKGIEKGIEQGIEQGIEKGIEQGIEKKQIDVVLKGFDHHLPLMMLANISGLSEDDIIQILKQHQKI